MTRMTARSGSSADGSGRWGRRVVAVALLAATGIAGAAACSAAPSSGGGGRTGQSPNTRPDEAVRTTIANGLNGIGATREAQLVKAGGSRLTQVKAPLGDTWRIYQVDYRQASHPVRFHVATGGNEAMLLTADPEAFDDAMTAANVTIADPADATRLAQVYVETTRSMSVSTYVVSSVRDIRFRPKLTEALAARRDAIVREFGDRIQPPRATSAEGGFDVTVFVVKDKALEERSVTVSDRGAITEKTDTLAPDLPVPYTV